jgi:hypothetical protein
MERGVFGAEKVIVCCVFGVVVLMESVWSLFVFCAARDICICGLTSLYNRANGGISDLTLCSQQPPTLCLDHGERGERRRRKRIDDGLHLSPSTAWFRSIREILVRLWSHRNIFPW